MGGAGGGAMEEVVMGLAGRFEEQIRVTRTGGEAGGGGGGGGRQRSASVGRSGAGGGLGGGDLGGMAVGLLGMAGQMEQRYVSSRRRAQSQSGPTPTDRGNGNGNGGMLQMLEREVATPQTAAILAGVVGAGMQEIKRRRSRSRSQSQPKSRAEEVPLPAPSSRASSRSRTTVIPRPLSTQARAYPYSYFSFPLKLISISSPTPAPKRFMSELTPHQHLAVRHAAATLLMKEPEMQHLTRHRSNMVSLLEHGENQAQGGGPTKGEFCSSGGGALT